jgi:hypothetical protein
MSVDRAGFVFIAGFGPATWAVLELRGRIAEPFKLVIVATHHHQRVAQVDRVIGAKAELAARLQLRREQIERAVVHHPPLGVARLGPGIGVEQIEETERAIRNPRQHFQRITVVDPDIAQRGMRATISIDMNQRLGHPVEERFGPDEAVIGQHIGARRHMLTPAKADFKMQRALIPEQRLRSDRAFCGHGNARQQGVNQSLLAGAQRFAFGTAIEPVERQRIAGFMRGHGGGPNGCAASL